ncbi:MAG: Nudix family hydrolase [Gammaproteobacteria bacterium]|nr:Nudix family hydrolase [Gammaproteobacteria bacterium]
MSSAAPLVHVVVGIVENSRDEILVMRRRADGHLGGHVEFPGGKLEAGESPEAALQRELKEELDIDMCRCRPLIQIPYSYADRNIFLDVFRVSEYSGGARSVEGQEIAWKSIPALEGLRFPKANHGIVRALQLPGLIPVTPGAEQVQDFLQHFEDTVRQSGVGLIHFRSHELDPRHYLQLAGECLRTCHRHQVRLVLNADASSLKQIDAGGLHLTSRRLEAVDTRPLGREYLVSASCHTLDEVLHASQAGLDYLFLGPVREKVSGGPFEPLGWKHFARLARQSAIPVYAIGGLGPADIDVAIAHGGQGVAAIRAVWQ